MATLPAISNLTVKRDGTGAMKAEWKYMRSKFVYAFKVCAVPRGFCRSPEHEKEKTAQKNNEKIQKMPVYLVLCCC